MKFYSHPLVAPDRVELRDYQVSIAAEALLQNTLVVLPTGMGKTPTALMVMTERLTQDKKVLMAAPTKPLCEQHHQSFERFLPYTAVRLLTGELPAHERLKEWNDAQVIIATPQTIENDLKNQVYNLKDVSLLAIDEAHRAVGGYAYTAIAKSYQETATNPLILAMTASPGGNEGKVDRIKDALFIDRVICKTEDDPDVIPYIHGKEIEKIMVDLPDLLARSSQICKAIMQDRCRAINQAGYKISMYPTQRQLDQLRRFYTDLIQAKDGNGYALASLYGEIMKLRHATKVAETQGLLPLRKYLKELFSGSKTSDRRLQTNEGLRRIYQEICDAGDEEIHPKTRILPSIVKTNLERDPNMRILVFAEFRDTVTMIVSLLKGQGIKAHAFTGQAKKGTEKGMNQKKQTDILNKFRSGEIQILVSTCVGEEGLDIPACDLVIFYEPVPSEVRSIQRSGRTGRFAVGTVLILITRGTQDEVNYFSSLRKEKAMRTMDHNSRQVKIGAET